MRRVQIRVKAARRNFIIGLIGSFVIGASWAPDEKKPEPAAPVAAASPASVAETPAVDPAKEATALEALYGVCDVLSNFQRMAIDLRLQGLSFDQTRALAEQGIEATGFKENMLQIVRKALLPQIDVVYTLPESVLEDSAKVDFVVNAGRKACKQKAKTEVGEKFGDASLR